MTAIEVVDDLRAAGLTIRRIERLTFVTKDAVYDWRAGRKSPRPDERRRLDALHAHLAEWGA